MLQIALDAAQGAAPPGRAPAIRTIRVRIGALTGIAPDSVRFYFDLISPGTAAAGACLDLQIEPATAHCGGCGQTFPVAPPLDGCCPACGSAPDQVTGGADLLVQSIEVE